MKPHSSGAARPDPSVIDRYLAGEASAAEREAMAAWLAAHPEQERLLGAIQSVTAAPTPGTAALDVDAVLDGVHERIAENIAASVARRPHRSLFASSRFTSARLVSPRVRLWRSAAAGLAVGAIVIVGGVVGLRRFGGFGGTYGVASQVRTYRTAVAQEATIVLDDGSRVTLAPQTTLRLTRFGARERTMTVDGEAYFDVARAAESPFVVRSGHVTTRVLGTAFLVRHYATDAAVRVAVESGKVSVSAQSPGRPTLTLTAGRVAVVTDSSLTASADDVSRYTGWRNGRLVFEEASITDVVNALSRWYGYQFRFADSSLTQQRLTIGLSTRSAASALSTLKLLLNVDLQFSGNVITLVPRTARRLAPPADDPRNALTTQNREVGR
jgi:ferric-dicitrate binding protein FerR (iron transport regulator)